MRVELRMSGPENLAVVLHWFVHRDEAGWILTISDVGDRIRSVPVEVYVDPITNPVAAAAELWPVMRTLGIGLDFACAGPRHLQSEIRVKDAARLFWSQATTWIWQDSRAVAYRSHPTIRRRTMSIPLAPPEELAQACYDFDAAFATQ
ncbi:hypothetical protein AYM40_06565 [Paraburkholderia phytofirmans OLGA172]|uniref:Uncharacterized protein n=1 Tax=Paraburkholderia phytofirmans OLGA172 TaxID=1417228 RepID=A0A160FIJ1_9BURK|nr:hypothetical protein AYM40_06565 [Paraburkholderia phytofirmans OLGA172]